MSTAHILVVDDEPDIRNLVQEILIDEGYEVVVAENAAEARELRRTRRPDLILLDIWMPDVDGITLLKEWQSEGSGNAPVIMMSGHGTVETAVEATRLGAYDFIEKPLSLAKLLLTVEHALEADKLQSENTGLREHLRPIIEPLGKSIIMQQLREQIERVAQHDAGVLISGEPGSGKNQAALYLHAKSSRADGPFIEVGVASIAGEHSATELFGSERDGKISYGRIEQANGGVLYFDDIADMDMATQGRLVSALDTGSFVRVGGSEPVKIDVRVIAASHHDLQKDIADEKFRDDLYYHLSVVPLQIPSLREHGEDISELLNHFIDLFVTHDHLPYRSFSVAAQNRLRNYVWPGNIRELQNLVQRILISGGTSAVEIDEIEPMLSQESISPAKLSNGMPSVFDLPLREAREQFEKAYFEHRLKEVSGSVGKLAKLAGIERTHLYRKLRALGIDTKKTTGSDS